MNSSFLMIILYFSLFIKRLIFLFIFFFYFTILYWFCHTLSSILQLAMSQRVLSKQVLFKKQTNKWILNKFTCTVRYFFPCLFVFLWRKWASYLWWRSQVHPCLWGTKALSWHGLIQNSLHFDTYGIIFQFIWAMGYMIAIFIYIGK